MTELQRKKLSSRRFLIVIWACSILSIWGTISLFQTVAHPWMAVVMPIIATVIAGYVAISSFKKKEGEE